MTSLQSDSTYRHTDIVIAIAITIVIVINIVTIVIIICYESFLTYFERSPSCKQEVAR